ncbi:UMP CMP kinase [Echinococcus multilocularis]|uniref:UMP CMP kinase n=1 Tax=Echinococcus multilocularis TaxID=6211 RepID=A0A068YMC4_ECHMU|nr:UMP CMP kinase [Echinococcus multilocularis]
MAAKQDSTHHCTEPFGVIFMLGGPGSGKGTICPPIASHFDMIHLSAGELLRKEMNSPNSKVAAEIESYMKAGTIVPVAITCSLLHKAMLEGYSNQKCVNYLVDGFPRNEDNKSGWEASMSDKTKVLQVVVLDCPDNVCIDRCLRRGSGRIDDNEKTLKNRLVQFKTEGLPVIEYYSKKGLVTHIDGSKSKEEVIDEVKAALNSIVYRNH